jgi:hypothetical protein
VTAPGMRSGAQPLGLKPSCTQSWRLRAKLGRRIRWYQTPEEITR